MQYKDELLETKMRYIGSYRLQFIRMSASRSAFCAFCDKCIFNVSPVFDS